MELEDIDKKKMNQLLQNMCNFDVDIQIITSVDLASFVVQENGKNKTSLSSQNYKDIIQAYLKQFLSYNNEVQFNSYQNIVKITPFLDEDSKIQFIEDLFKILENQNNNDNKKQLNQDMINLIFMILPKIIEKQSSQKLIDVILLNNLSNSDSSELIDEYQYTDEENTDSQNSQIDNSYDSNLSQQSNYEDKVTIRYLVDNELSYNQKNSIIFKQIFEQNEEIQLHALNLFRVILDYSYKLNQKKTQFQVNTSYLDKETIPLLYNNNKKTLNNSEKQLSNYSQSSKNNSENNSYQNQNNINNLFDLHEIQYSLNSTTNEDLVLLLFSKIYDVYQLNQTKPIFKTQAIKVVLDIVENYPQEFLQIQLMWDEFFQFIKLQNVSSTIEYKQNKYFQWKFNKANYKH
ncbi:hypothetical protein PPERSA_00994 [Pseudocohnilembus persalinus]|uniref:Uncharacterized protein n=1 Tax=Pseudocohnilembus persalinus TaxID=266149 RepID=A0A0V0R9D6_PSEPJ|nr:hypothetical protein PPERSA_00994 [Pseudocohnilembus persalinus]|eukprot:KRX10824.1 hypothetical protein PPERSA_00994 [Pseudocohnilembus persalinus]